MANLLNFLSKKNTKSTKADSVGPRRQAILKSLLENRHGLTADDLASRLGVTRSAIHQHISALERDHYVRRSEFSKTKGRPGHVFVLTDEGIHHFPKRYDWFSELLLGALSNRLSEDELRDELTALGRKIGENLKTSSTTGDLGAQLTATASAMTDLGYVARAVTNDDGEHEIQAFNCVYHHLAVEHPEVCEFDLSLLETIHDQRPEHVECVVRGGGSCRFKFNGK